MFCHACSWFCSTQEGATWQSAHAFATQAFWSAAAAAQLVPLQQDEQNQQAHQPKLQLQLFSWDGGPRPMPSGANLEQHNHRFKTLRVTVSDICSRSTAHSGMVLGNVLYMDSFVDVSSVPCTSAGVAKLVVPVLVWGPEGRLPPTHHCACRMPYTVAVSAASIWLLGYKCVDCMRIY